jgi:methyl-accepting chemotaxis protein-1 (serine sensor receptor)
VKGKASHREASIVKLSIKVPLVFSVALVVMLVAALYGIHSLNRSLSDYQTVVQASNDSERAVGELTIAFKAQVQEWKDTLLRGKNPADLDKYWKAFNEREHAVADKAAALGALLPDGQSKSLVDEFATAHARMGDSYHKGFEAYKAAGLDSSVGDAAVRGIDREPVKLLVDAAAAIAADRAAIAARVAGDASRASVISLAIMALTCAAGLAVGMLLSRNILRQLGSEPQAAVDLARTVAQGDLTAHHAVTRGDPASLMGRLQEMQTCLAQVVATVRGNAESVSSASAQIAQGNHDLSGRTEQQASALEQTAAAMEQLGAAVRQNADNARQANQLALGASAVASRGGATVGEVVATMNGINDSSRKIAEITSVIDGIAFQTNILALNAAVEAARAGEQGRGFAVVASEVRSLAQRSAAAAREIKSLVTASVERVEQGTAQVGRAGATMTEIVAAIKGVTDIVGEISAASSEQSSAVTQVGAAVNQLDQATQQNAVLVEKNAAAAESMDRQAQQLVLSVAVFKLA